HPLYFLLPQSCLPLIPPWQEMSNPATTVPRRTGAREPLERADFERSADQENVTWVTIGDNARRDTGHLQACAVESCLATEDDAARRRHSDLILPGERRSSDAITCAAACGCLRSMAASALRHRFADIRDTRKRLATYQAVAPAASINSATAGHT